MTRIHDGRLAKSMSTPIYFVHITDTHIGDTTSFLLDGFNTYDHAQRLIETVNDLPVQPDFIIHTGDVSATVPNEASYILAEQLFSQLNAPVYYVSGNHDQPQMMRQHLTFGQKNDLWQDEECLVYTFDFGDERFLVLDGSGDLDIVPRGRLGERQLNLVKNEILTEGKNLTIFIHFPLLSLDSPWMDDNMLLVNGEELHQALLPARNRIRGIFHGHLHQPMQMTRDGITYTCARSSFGQFSAWPNETSIQNRPHELPGFGFAHLVSTHTIYHHHIFERP